MPSSAHGCHSFFDLIHFCPAAQNLAVSPNGPPWARARLSLYPPSRIYRRLVHYARTLRDRLGARLVAYLGLVKKTRVVRQWADAADPRKPSALVENRLRAAYQIAGTLREADSAAVIQAWFQGMNPLLDDYSPAKVLREGDPEESGPRVLAAARAFASSSAA
jgi:hypothetical protein